MKGQLHIDLMYAFVVRDDDGTEGVCGIRGGQGEWLPLVGADLARVESLRPIVEHLATHVLKKPITLAVFKERHNLETFEP